MVLTAVGESVFRTYEVLNCRKEFQPFDTRARAFAELLKEA